MTGLISPVPLGRTGSGEREKHTAKSDQINLARNIGGNDRGVTVRQNGSNKRTAKRCEASQRSQRRCSQPVPQLKLKRQRRFQAVISAPDPLQENAIQIFLEMQIDSL